MAGVGSRLLGLCLPPVLFCTLDAGLTLSCQSASYWGGEYFRVSEGSPTPNHLLQIHPSAFATGILLWEVLIVTVILLLPDVLALMDHLQIARADVMGYSLGSRMTAILAREQPQRLRSAILGGIGIGLIEGGGPGENVATALEAPSLDDVTDPVGRTFRAFADQTRSDRRALAACLRGSRRLMTSEEAAGIGVPVLIAVGTNDEIAGSAAALGKSEGHWRG